MTEEQIALAKRAVACKGWRWMSGMLRGDGFRCTWVDEDERELAAPTWCANGIEWMNSRTGSKDLPDLTEPATLGCLLALVREAWGAPRALVRLSANGKSFHVFDVDRVTMGGNWAAFLCGDRNHRTEAHALVAALEAAPVQ
jgi:hypothetical protein